MIDRSSIEHDPFSGREVIFAPHRRNRPHTASSGHDHARPEETCPFCPGNEAMLPDILWQQGGKKDWQARAVSNLYPIVSPPDGHHEIIIDTPRHGYSPGAMTTENWNTILESYRGRLQSLSRTWSYVSIFRNVGKRAGESLGHPHSQLIALANTPARILSRLQRLHHEYETTGQCLLCRVIHADEQNFAGRIVTQNSMYLAFVPKVAEVPFEVWIAPRAHSSAFSAAQETDGNALAALLSDVFRRMTAVLGEFDHNMMLVDDASQQKPHIHWYLRIRPVGDPIGGFERATGVAVNTSDPENDAATLRKTFAHQDMASV